MRRRESSNCAFLTGIFIAMTIVLSTFYSFGLFIVLLAFVGRNESRNDFVTFWRKLTCKSSEFSCLKGNV